jgi:hypothetical protein
MATGFWKVWADNACLARFFTRHPGELLFNNLAKFVDPNMTVCQLFADGPVEVVIFDVKGDQVKVGVDVPPELSILRDELVE